MATSKRGDGNGQTYEHSNDSLGHDGSIYQSNGSVSSNHPGDLPI